MISYRQSDFQDYMRDQGTNIGDRVRFLWTVGEDRELEGDIIDKRIIAEKYRRKDARSYDVGNVMGDEAGSSFHNVNHNNIIKVLSRKSSYISQRKYADFQDYREDQDKTFDFQLKYEFNPPQRKNRQILDTRDEFLKPHHYDSLLSALEHATDYIGGWDKLSLEVFESDARHELGASRQIFQLVDHLNKNPNYYFGTFSNVKSQPSEQGVNFHKGTITGTFRQK